MDTHESKHLYRHWSGWITAVVVIVIGVIFLLNNFGVRFNFMQYRNWWALFILIGAVGPLSHAAYRYRTQGRFDGAVLHSLISTVAIITGPILPAEFSLELVVATVHRLWRAVDAGEPLEAQFRFHFILKKLLHPLLPRDFERRHRHRLRPIRSFGQFLGIQYLPVLHVQNPRGIRPLAFHRVSVRTVVENCRFRQDAAAVE